MAHVVTADIGDVVELAALFEQDDGPIDPPVVRMSTKTPLGVIVQYLYGTDAELQRTGLGAYRFVFTPAVPGLWAFRFASTNGVTAAEEGYFLVNKSLFVG